MKPRSESGTKASVLKRSLMTVRKRDAIAPKGDPQARSLFNIIFIVRNSPEFGPMY
jgi:hypothetical protein